MKIVADIQGVAVTTSRMIAQVFGKKHYHVLRDIDQYLKEGHIEMHPDLDAPFCVKTSTYKDNSNRDSLEYLITSSACTLIIMAYTGSKAMEFKKAYIMEFDKMQNTLLKREKAMADIDDAREVGRWEDCHVEGFHGIIEELGLC